MSAPFRVRVCPVCGTENPANLSECSQCGTDILGEPVETRSPNAPAAQKPEPIEGPKVVLEVLQQPDLSFEVGENMSVGRTDAADVVLTGAPNVDYISKRMAVFTRRGDQWYVRHVASTNFITVDGERYESDDDVAIHNGSILGLALTQFSVRIPDST